MAEVGSAHVSITADDSSARRVISGFFGFLKKSSSLTSGIVSSLSTTIGGVATVAVGGLASSFAAAGTSAVAFGAVAVSAINSVLKRPKKWKSLKKNCKC
ncbi:hypothetical protein [Peribacillus asahii]|uniref:hypothetical protein n=1 Tax=Peribacillus asahii TaxID=228899 RepID=UPI00207AF8F4|nr:hypothetical protein [Peribacillus asahii]USK72720.1 hypothetical protein LIS76_24040 [Peribacillus asahii]